MTSSTQTAHPLPRQPAKLPEPEQLESHVPQSAVQTEHTSLPLQMPSPQKPLQVPQSAGQVLQVSVPLQVPSPQVGQLPQSCGQLEQVSVPLQLPSGHCGPHGPQSIGQLEQVSLPLQVPSPHTGAQVPQSAGQLLQVSVPLQVPSPQRGPPVVPPLPVELEPVVVEPLPVEPEVLPREPVPPLPPPIARAVVEPELAREAQKSASSAPAAQNDWMHRLPSAQSLSVEQLAQRTALVPPEQAASIAAQATRLVCQPWMFISTPAFAPLGRSRGAHHSRRRATEDRHRDPATA